MSNTATTTRPTGRGFDISDSTAAQIREAFQYWPAVPALTSYTSTDQLQADYERQSGGAYWFSPDTLRFFGSRNRELVAPGIMVECQTNAPEGYPRYVVTAWVLDPDAARDHRTLSGRITPQNIGKFHTRAEAKRFALAAAAEWPTLAS